MPWDQDLSGLGQSIYTEEDVTLAREVLDGLFAEAGLPSAPARPTGKNPSDISLQWWSSGIGALSQTVYLAQTLYGLHQNVTRRSRRILYSKLRELLQLRGAPFEDLLAEFRIAALLTDRFSPMALDPSVPKDLLVSPSRPATCDYAIRLPDQDVFLEATVLRVQSLDRLNAALADANHTLISHLRKSREGRLSISLGFQLSHQDVRPLTAAIKELLRSEAAEPFHRRPLDFPGGRLLYISWEPIPHFASLSDLEESGFTGEVATIGDGVTSVAGVDWSLEPAVAQILEPSVVKSVLNKLKRKRDQFLYGGPYCLILALGNYRLRQDGILAKAQSCLASSPKLSWISAIAVFTPRVDFESPEARPRLTFGPNPRARFPLSSHFWDGVSRKATYHLP